MSLLSAWSISLDSTFKVTEEESDPDSLVRGADSDPHQKVMDPQHCLLSIKNSHSDVNIKGTWQWGGFSGGFAEIGSS